MLYTSMYIQVNISEEYVFGCINISEKYVCRCPNASNQVTYYRLKHNHNIFK